MGRAPRHAGKGGDRESWGFESIGEAVALTLEGDGADGYIDGAATLRLEREGAVVDEVSGPLPLELGLPLEAGAHRLVVLEAHRDGAEDAAFRGNYLLTVVSEGGAPANDGAGDLLLEPQPDVEPY